MILARAFMLNSVLIIRLKLGFLKQLARITLLPARANQSVGKVRSS